MPRGATVVVLLYSANVSNVKGIRDLSLNPLNTGGLFHCYILDESIFHFRDVGSISSLLFYFLWKILLANNVDPDQTPHYVASDLDLHCLSMTLLQVSR